MSFGAIEGSQSAPRQAAASVSRRHLRVRGLVQGVGFRPFVYRLAERRGLVGWVRNETDGVAIEIEGPEAELARFTAELRRDVPPAAHVHELEWAPAVPLGERTFRIEPSRSSASRPVLPVDQATCDACLAELFDPGDRRYRYPFITCTDCGPRLTVVDGTPYDRRRTAMRDFAPCAACSAEYDDPASRRFHAESIACAVCGPRLELRNRSGAPVGSDPVGEVVRALRAGRIVAVKGLGGVHLACDAAEEHAVRELRRRKGRDEKPFAVMVRDLPAARRLCRISAEEEALLCSAARPIVLLRRDSDGVAPGVAPGAVRLGLMLAYTPVHHLLLRDLEGRPLVMTSGNASDEPIACDNDDALRRLGALADLFLLHDRDIRVRCDDSVALAAGGRPVPVRRSRGYVPSPVQLPFTCASAVLAVGGDQKSVFALGQGREAVLSPHQGDLDGYEAYSAYVEAVERHERLLAAAPRVIAHDLHPDYASTRYAKERAERDGLRRCAVQHHHAHLASAMTDNGLTGAVIGVTFDGTGYGTDGTVWGGEFLTGDCRAVRRAGHLRPVRMPGGTRAIREPWRMAVAHLASAGEDPGLLADRIPGKDLDLVRRVCEGGPNAPWTSSAGRLFDAVASLLGLRDRASYEGQAAMELEALASGSDAREPYPWSLTQQGETWVADTGPLMRGLAADLRCGKRAAELARRFHASLVELIRRMCLQIREDQGLDRIVFSGGVFMNVLLAVDAEAALVREGFRVYQHRAVPPNDGGLCLGQLAVAAAQEG